MSDPEIRRDLILGHGVIIAPDRARRPDDFRSESAAASILGADSPTCPFCEGREEETPPEVDSVRAPGTFPDGPGWTVRVVPNKYPALIPGRAMDIRPDGPNEAANGIGVHEVVIDSPDHGLELADMSIDQLRDLLRIFQKRLRAIEAGSLIRYLQIFKNKGEAAGASLRHPHTQILAVPIIPPRIRDECDAEERYWRTSGGCRSCRLIETEAAGPRRIHLDSEIVAVAPFVSRFPYEMHLVPRRHGPFFSDSTEEEQTSLARTISRVFNRLRDIGADSAYHLILRQAPVLRTAREEWPDIEAFSHWRWEILPVTAKVAGFEWGTGLFINPVPPESAAGLLRE